jgi:hypothetical protein
MKTEKTLATRLVTTLSKTTGRGSDHATVIVIDLFRVGCLRCLSSLCQLGPRQQEYSRHQLVRSLGSERRRA